MSATDYDPFIAPKVGHLQEAAAQTRRAGGGNDEADFSFGDLLDVLNPLQHLPVVGNIYRELTGDQIGGTARIIGGGLYGGPLGLVSAAFNQIFEDATGRDMAETALAVATGQELGNRPASDLAETEPQQTTAEPAAAFEEQATAQAGVNTAAVASSPQKADDPTGVDGPIDPDLLTGQAALYALAADMRSTARPAAEPQNRATDPQATAVATQQLSSRTAVTPASFMPVSARDFAGPRPQTSPVSPAAALPATAPAAEAETAAKTSPIAPTPQPGSAAEAPTVSNSLLMPSATSDTDFADRMMQALIKYEALSKEQAGAATGG
ncbi:hypothetical protein [Algihabitans albus]|uniref:hypothetical protein n=1 Tax=Algihabitans albus TaxID=2164067 RepID=UPI000E5D969F|nr:hypothetical protein [Algihabitans albus]